MIRTLLVDDEPASRMVLRELIEKEPSFSIMAEAENGLQAVEMIESNPPDLVFLDIQMPGLDGFGVIREVGIDRMPPVIFVTAYSAHAIHAFDVNAVDYVVKPVNLNRFKIALERARRLQDGRYECNKKLELLMASIPSFASAGAGRIVLKDTASYDILNTDDIIFIEAQRDYVLFHTKTGRHIKRARIRDIEQQLNPRAFCRIHRSYIVNLSRVRNVKQENRMTYRAYLDTGIALPVSQPHMDNLLRVLSSR